MISEQDLFQLLLDNSPDYIFFKDRQSCFIRSNRAHTTSLLALAGPTDVIGKTDFDLFPEEDAQRFFDEEQQIMETGNAILAREWEVPNAGTGEIMWLSEHKVPIKDEKGQIIGLLGISRDITVQKKAEIEEEKRSAQLKAAADVGYAASRILDPQELIQHSVDLIGELFDRYFVGLYLIEGNPYSDEKLAFLRAATGEIGAQLLHDGHKLKVNNQSLVGKCIDSGEAVIAQDVAKESAHTAHELLPLTRSEMVIPLVSRGETIGALTVQSRQESIFTSEDATVYQIMAGQLAIALENARLFAQVEQELEEAKEALRKYVRKGWSDYLSK
ncbi:MAG: PAS domain-containing protein [Anaerolineae bacterium]|nr:PAS domain-containing protein [Anaerolineae bacterium]